MTESICQSCGMPMNQSEHFGREKDGSRNEEYCIYCYENGELLDAGQTLEQMIESCVPFMVQEGMKEEEARTILNNTLPNLKRWKPNLT